MTITNDEHRQARLASIYTRAYEIAQKQYPQLAPGQHAALARHIQDHAAYEEFSANGTLDPGDDWIRSEFSVAVEYNAPQMFRIAPSVETLTGALVAKLPPGASPQEQMTLARRVATMSADERLLASNGLDLSAPAPAPKVIDTRTPEQKARQYTPEDVILEQRGHNPNSMDPHKRVEYRRSVMDENRVKPTTNIDEVRTLLSMGREPATTVLMSAEREAQAMGKKLVDFVNLHANAKK